MKRKAPERHRLQKTRKKPAPKQHGPAPPDIDISERPPLNRTNGKASVVPLDVTSGGGDLQTGHTFVDGEEFNAAAINGAINNSTIQAGFITSKPSSIPLGSDLALFFQGSTSQLRQTSLAQIAGLGALQSVGLSMPSDFTVGNSPLTSSGTIAVTANNQPANFVKVGPSSGAAAAPTYRHLVPADVSFAALGAGGTSIDWSAGTLFYRVLTAGTTVFTFDNQIDERILVVLEQGSGGSKLVTWPAGIHWDTGGPPSLATVVGARDILEFFKLGSIGIFGKLWGRTTS